MVYLFFCTIRKYKLTLYTARRANTCEDSVFVGASRVFFKVMRVFEALIVQIKVKQL